MRKSPPTSEKSMKDAASPGGSQSNDGPQRQRSATKNPQTSRKRDRASKNTSTKGSDKRSSKKKANIQDHQRSQNIWQQWNTDSEHQASPTRSQKTRRPPGQKSSPGHGPHDHQTNNRWNNRDYPRECVDRRQAPHSSTRQWSNVDVYLIKMDPEEPDEIQRKRTPVPSTACGR